MPTPDFRTWTLKFKRGLKTVVLHVEPTETWSTIRAELLTALVCTNPTGSLDGIAIPKSPDDILLARPVDPHDFSAGWEAIDNGSDGGMSRKGKANVAASSGKAGTATKTQSIMDSPKGIGLRDGGVLAFKFKEEKELEARRRADMKTGGGDDDIEVDEEDMDRPEVWDVVVPSVEETYADEIEVDEDEGVEV